MDINTAEVLGQVFQSGVRRGKAGARRQRSFKDSPQMEVGVEFMKSGTGEEELPVLLGNRN